MKKILIALNLLFSSFVFSAEGMYRGKMYRHIANDEKVLSENKLMVLGLTLYDSGINDAFEKIGKSPIIENGTGSGHYGQICYEGPDAMLLLEFPYQRYAPRKLQNVIISTNKRIQEAYAPCTPSSQIDKDFSFIGGLRLGMSQKEVEKIWGTPGLAKSDVMIYDIRRIQKEFFTDDVSIYLEFKKGKLVYVDASRMAFE